MRTGKQLGRIIDGETIIYFEAITTHHHFVITWRTSSSPVPSVICTSVLATTARYLFDALHYGSGTASHGIMGGHDFGKHAADEHSASMAAKC